MNKLTVLLIPAVFLTLISTASAADVLGEFPLKHALESEKVKEAIDGNIPLYWGDQRHPAVEKEFGKIHDLQAHKRRRQVRSRGLRVGPGLRHYRTPESGISGGWKRGHQYQIQHQQSASFQHHRL